LLLELIPGGAKSHGHRRPSRRCLRAPNDRPRALGRSLLRPPTGLNIEH
jgi:hypothetical protein